MMRLNFLPPLFILLLFIYPSPAKLCAQVFQRSHGAIVRGNTTQPVLALVFTGDRYADGGEHIMDIMKKHGIKGSFFFTGDFYRNRAFAPIIEGLIQGGHYLGAHSDRHLLYCSWENRDSLLVDRATFKKDLLNNYREMARFGIAAAAAPYFLPPYEWYNVQIAAWTEALGFTLINMTHGTRSHADYTVPPDQNYIDSEAIYRSILQYEAEADHGLNGFLLLSHIGVHPERKDKFYTYLEALITTLKERGYGFQRVDELLAEPK